MKKIRTASAKAKRLVIKVLDASEDYISVAMPGCSEEADDRHIDLVKATSRLERYIAALEARVDTLQREKRALREAMKHAER